MYLLRIIATNGVKPGASQTFTLIVLQRPQITSADHATCTVGKACAFTVTSTGVPIPNLSELGKLPSRVRFKDNGNGTAALSGTPASNTGGTYKIAIIARNGASPDIQHFTLTVVGPRPRRAASKP